MSNRFSQFVNIFGVIALVLAFVAAGYGQVPATPVKGEAVLHPADLDELLPKNVFFRGQTAPVQLRNSGGVKFADGFYFFASLIDTSGYSSSLQAKYQAYLITEVPLQIGDHTLQPGAYGVGFIADHQFVVMDIGAHDLLTATFSKNESLHRPMPLQVIGDEATGSYRLYEGRNYISIKRVVKP